jgi:hypothetical protein
VLKINEEGKVKLKLKPLLLLTRAQLRAALYRFLMPLLATRQEVTEETRFRQAEIASLLVR